MKKIITHPGMVHLDELLAIASICTLYHVESIERKEPSEEELEDVDTLCIDVGGRYEVEKGNFDHHQFERGDERCALSLVLQWLFPEDARPEEAEPHLKMVRILDSVGPTEFEKRFGFSPEVLSGPIVVALKKWFAEDPSSTIPFLIEIGKEIIEEVSGLAAEEEMYRNHCFHIDYEATCVVISPQKFKHLRRIMDRSPFAVDVFVSPDDRGEGYSIYRADDSPYWDFSRLKDDPLVSFAHNNGFIAKTHVRLPLTVLKNLLDKALIHPEGTRLKGVILGARGKQIYDAEEEGGGER